MGSQEPLLTRTVRPFSRPLEVSPEGYQMASSSVTESGPCEAQKAPWTPIPRSVQEAWRWTLVGFNDSSRRREHPPPAAIADDGKDKEEEIALERPAARLSIAQHG